MMMKNMKKLSLAVIAISTAMLSTSCLREENFGKADSKFISLKVSTEGIAETKAGHVAEPLEVVDLSQDGLDLFLYGSVKVNKMSPFEPMTKAGRPYGAAAADTVSKFDIQMNNTAGYANREKRADYWYIYSNGEKLTWESETAPSYYLAYYPQNVEGATTKASFANSTTIDYVGDGTQDLLVAYKKHSHVDSTYPTSDENYIPLTFRHPLALVKFNVVGVNVTKIVINNAAVSGKINGETLECTPDAIGPVEATLESDGVYSVYVMPGEFGADKMNVTFYVGGKVLTTLNLGTDKWNGGFIYNYTIASDTGKLNIEFVEEAEPIEVANTLATAVYLRAAVVANWVDTKGRIVESADPVTFNTDGWVIGTDGYLYYKTPVIGYQQADALIKEIADSVNGELKLQVAVAVQAVEYDQQKKAATSAWGSTAAGYLGTL